MVTQHTSQSPQNGPAAQSRRHSGSSSLSLNHQSQHISPIQAASSPRQQTSHQDVSETNQNSAGITSSNTFGDNLGLLQPETWKPRAGVTTTDNETHGEATNAWDEQSHPPGYYELSRPDATVRSSETNPFLRRPMHPTSSNAALPGQESTYQQQHRQPQQPQQPQKAQSQSQLNDAFSSLVFDEQPTSHNPWQSAMDENPARVASSYTHPAPPSETATDLWVQPTPAPSSGEPRAPQSPTLVSLQSDGSGWEDTSDSIGSESDEDQPPQAQSVKDRAFRRSVMVDELMREEQAWDDDSALADEKRAGLEAPSETTEPPTAATPGSGSGTTASGTGSTALDDWNIVDSNVYTPSSKGGSPSQSSQFKAREAGEAGEAGEAIRMPQLPPRQTGDQTRWTSSRLPPDGSSETYQVKNIRWNDPSSKSNPRVSPILMQNQNGPCPLVALVNALTLTTPSDVSDTSLVNVLSSREQVSLNLLLDAVFDELMSPRRTKTDDSLPDVTDLYAFLQSLHTGMNVNPRFIPTLEMMDAFRRTSLTHVDPEQRGRFIPGTFENTLEMSLYAAFSIPLIHGWLPDADDPAYGAMYRHASSYEDTQNLLFREEELERKLGSDMGLTEGEQNLYHDIVTIKCFLDSSATQLTPWGIEVIGKVMRPGTFAILFRNDHFSTLYCHPDTLQLFTLVTDAGYESHSDIVWESLVDVNGEGNEYLTGDFRPLGSAATTSSWADHDSTQRGELQHTSGRTQFNPEQEDRDLALALQLQEEEDQKHRRHEERRKRESLLSERFIEQNANRHPGAQVEARAGNQLVPRRRSSNGINVPPPGSTTTTTATTGANTTINPAAAAANGPPSRRRDPRHPAPPTHFEQIQRIQLGQQAPPSQQVRALVPPLRRPGVNRPVNTDEEPPPPSYEQAAQVPVYHPPPGHPTHPGSVASWPSRRGGAMSAGSHATVGAPGAGFSEGTQRLSNSSAGRRMPASAGMANPSRERECIVM